MTKTTDHDCEHCCTAEAFPHTANFGRCLAPKPGCAHLVVFAGERFCFHAKWETFAVTPDVTDAEPKRRK